MKTAILIFLLIVSILASADKIFSWTAPDGQLYMVSSKEKLDEIKKKYGINKSEQESIENIDKKDRVKIKEKVQAQDKKDGIPGKNVSKGNAGYLVISLLSAIVGILLGAAYNIRASNKKNDSINDNIKILAVIDRKIL